MLKFEAWAPNGLDSGIIFSTVLLSLRYTVQAHFCFSLLHISRSLMFAIVGDMSTVWRKGVNWYYWISGAEIFHFTRFKESQKQKCRIEEECWSIGSNLEEEDLRNVHPTRKQEHLPVCGMGRGIRRWDNFTRGWLRQNRVGGGRVWRPQSTQYWRKESDQLISFTLNVFFCSKHN